MSDAESVGSGTSKKSKKDKKSKKEKKSKKDKDGGSSRRGRDRERSRSPSRMRASSGKKATAGVGDLTMEEMADRVKKFGKLTVDEKSGAGTLDVVQKRLMPEDVDILLELFKRFTEVQHVKFQRCFMTDDVFKTIVMEGLIALRHLKSLVVPFNMLSDDSALLVIQQFSKKSRQLQKLDFRSNTLSEEVAVRLYRSFPAIQYLHEIPIYRTKREVEVTEIDLSKKMIKVADIKILTCLLNDIHPCHIESVDLSSNNISAKALRLLAEGLRKVSMQNLDISNNPLTDGDLDHTGMEELFWTTHKHKHICNIKHDGVEFPEEFRDRLENSLAVNRQLYDPPVKEGLIKDKFSTYIYSLVEERTPALPENAMEFDKDAIPDFVIDKQFYKINRLPTIAIDADDKKEGSVGRPTQGKGKKGGFNLRFIRDVNEGKKRFDAFA